MTKQHAIEIVAKVAKRLALECNCCVGDYTCDHTAPLLVDEIVNALDADADEGNVVYFSQDRGTV